MKIVLSTLPSDFDAEGFAKNLLGKKLAACVNIIRNISSVYVWKEKLCSDAESLLFIKTSEEKLIQLQLEFESSHPYEVFEFVVLNPEQVGRRYEQWLVQSLQGAD